MPTARMIFQLLESLQTNLKHKLGQKEHLGTELAKKLSPGYDKTTCNTIEIIPKMYIYNLLLKDCEGENT